MDEIQKCEQEIQVRINRETAYVLAYANITDEVGRAYLIGKIEQNDEVIKILGSWLKSKGSDWERFYEANRQFAGPKGN